MLMGIDSELIAAYTDVLHFSFAENAGMMLDIGANIDKIKICLPMRLAGKK